MLSFAGIDTERILLHAMNTAELNHRVIANNVANVDTPHFNATELDFQKTLRSAVEGRGGFALRTTRPRHFDFTSHRPQFERLAFLSKNDYNKVDLDDQMLKLSENTGKYTTYSNLLFKRFQETKDLLGALQR